MIASFTCSLRCPPVYSWRWLVMCVVEGPITGVGRLRKEKGLRVFSQPFTLES
jgi:hypothetical protein